MLTRGKISNESELSRSRTPSNQFTGEFILNNPLGCFWVPLAQAGALVLSESAYSEVGGCDNVRITADGNTITVPGAWVNMGTDSISEVAAAINDITVIKKADRIEYIVKVS